MNTNEQLPTDDLKFYGIMKENNQYSEKLSPDMIQGFLNGKTLVVFNDNQQLSFRLFNNNTELDVNHSQRDKSLETILQNSKNEIQYSEISFSNLQNDEVYKKTSVFIYDNENDAVNEYDLATQSNTLTNIILEKENPIESNKYFNELMKMKSYLQDKIDQFPEAAKQITENLNIVSKQVNLVNVNNDVTDDVTISKKNDSEIRLDVNDPDLYQDANLDKEIQNDIEEEQNNSTKRGFRR